MTADMTNIAQPPNPVKPSAAAPASSSAPTSAGTTTTVVAKPHGGGPVALSPSIAVKTVVSLTHTAQALSTALGHSTDPKSLVCEIKTGKGGQMEVTVTFSGMWDGKYIRGAVRAIEHEYKKLKHNVTRMNAGKHSVTN